MLPLLVIDSRMRVEATGYRNLMKKRNSSAGTDFIPHYGIHTTQLSREHWSVCLADSEEAGSFPVSLIAILSFQRGQQISISCATGRIGYSELIT